MPLPEARFYPVSAAITQVLSQSERAPETLSSVLRILHQELKAEFSALWRVDYEQVVLRCVALVTAENAYPNFRTVSLARVFPVGEGLPGRVWKERGPLWIPDISQERNFPRQSVAAMEELRCAIAFPILHGNRVLGVYEFLFRECRPFRPVVMEFMVSAGRQIGLFLERMRVEYELTGSDETFHRLSDRYVDAIITIDERGSILYVNPALERLVGYSAAELHGKNLTVLMPPDLAIRHEVGFRRYIETGKRHISWDGVALRALHRDGHEFPVEIAFAETRRLGQRVFSGYLRPLGDPGDQSRQTPET